MVAEGLQHLVLKAEGIGLVKGTRLHKGHRSLALLQYADDTHQFFEASLSSISNLKIPDGIFEEIDGMIYRFVWGGDHNKRRLSFISWSQACLPIDCSGLGLSHIDLKNNALLLKWFWCFLKEPDSLWAKVIVAIHGNPDPNLVFPLSKLPSNSRKVGTLCQIWKLAISNNPLADLFRKKVGISLSNGNMVKCWHDRLVVATPLSLLFLRLFRISLNKDDYINRCGLWYSLGWQWSLVCHHELHVGELELLAELLRLISSSSGGMRISGSDYFVWLLNLGGFSVKCLYDLIFFGFSVSAPKVLHKCFSRQ